MSLSSIFHEWSEVKWSAVKSLSRVQFFATPWPVAYQTPPSMGFSRQEYWSGLPFPSPGDLPNPGIETRSPALQADALPSEPPGKSDILKWKYKYFASGFVLKSIQQLPIYLKQMHKMFAVVFETFNNMTPILFIILSHIILSQLSYVSLKFPSNKYDFCHQRTLKRTPSFASNTPLWHNTFG